MNSPQPNCPIHPRKATPLSFLSPAIPRIPAVLSLLVLIYLEVVWFAPEEPESTRDPTNTEVFFDILYWPITFTAISLLLHGLRKLLNFYQKPLPGLTQTIYAINVVTACVWAWLVIGLIITNIH